MGGPGWSMLPGCIGTAGPDCRSTLLLLPTPCAARSCISVAGLADPAPQLPAVDDPHAFLHFPTAAAHLAEEQEEDVGARLQHKLWEWQQRLERAAHLRSAERADQQGSLVNCGAAAGAAAPAGTAGSAGGFGSSQPAAPDSPASSGGSFVSASPLAGSLQAALEAAAASSVCTDDAVSASSSPSAATAGAAWPGGASSTAAAGGVAAEAAAAEAEGSPSSGIAALTFAPQQESPRILAARPGAAERPAAAGASTVAAAALAPGEAVAAAGTPNKGRIGGSRIKALGLKAALSPAQKPQQAAGQEA